MRTDTKEKIVKTALYEFAAQGYDQTATRDILSKAHANVAAISYYFGHKKGLYIEVLTRIAKRIADAFKDLLPAYAELKKKTASPKECEELLKKFIRVFVELFCSDKQTTAMCMVFVREYVEPSREFKSFFQEINADYRRIFVDLLIRANRGEIAQKEAVLQVVMLFSFIFSLVTRKKIIMDAMEWKEYSSQAVDELMSVISRSLFRK